MKFPRMVYKIEDKGDWQTKTKYKLVNNDNEYSSAISDGWFESVIDAVSPPKKQEEKALTIEDESSSQRQDLELKAKELKIKFNKKTSDEKLFELIQEAESTSKEEIEDENA